MRLIVVLMVSYPEMPIRWTDPPGYEQRSIDIGVKLQKKVYLHVKFLQLSILALKFF